METNSSIANEIRYAIESTAARIDAAWIRRYADYFEPGPTGWQLHIDGVVVFIDSHIEEAFVWGGNEYDPDFDHQGFVYLGETLTDAEAAEIAAAIEAAQ